MIAIVLTDQISLSPLVVVTANVFSDCLTDKQKVKIMWLWKWDMKTSQILYSILEDSNVNVLCYVNYQNQKTGYFKCKNQMTYLKTDRKQRPQ